jgi:hypothetical protein
MRSFDDDHGFRLPAHRRAGIRRGAALRRCRLHDTASARPRLTLVPSRLVPSRPRPTRPLGMHPALPSTLAFAAVSAAALAVAAVIDVANAVARAATAVSERLATVR